MPNAICFYTSQAKSAPAVFMNSHSHKAPITSSDGKVLGCNEQYYRSRKAQVIEKQQCEKTPKPYCADTHYSNIYDAIMAEEKSADNITKMGRDFELEGDALKEWQESRASVLYDANYLTFKQKNPDERAWLISTGDAELVKAATRGRECGIGFTAATAEANRGRWGANMLGLALQRVRAVLNEELKDDRAGFMLRDAAVSHRMNEKHRADRQPWLHNTDIQLRNLSHHCMHSLHSLFEGL